MGSGYYANKLSYKEWYMFNSAQRAHLNFVEMIASSLIFLLIGGLYCPCTASGLGGVMIIGRLAYALGYKKKGPHGRFAGALLNVVSNLALFIMGVLYVVSIIRGSGGCSHANPVQTEL